MHLDKVLQGETQKIEKESTRDKNAVSYLVDLIEDNYDNFVEAFKEILINKFKWDSLEIMYHRMKGKGVECFEFFKDELYGETKNMIEDLNDVTGHCCMRYPTSDQTPDVKLGYMEYSKENPEQKSFGKRLTEKGTKLIEDYKKAKGLRSIEEERENMRDALSYRK
jgi:hypothetical protein